MNLHAFIPYSLSLRKWDFTIMGIKLKSLYPIHPKELAKNKKITEDKCACKYLSNSQHDNGNIFWIFGKFENP